jgi:hypothetical protein
MADHLPAMTAVASTNIHSVGHDGSALFVRFHDGGTYRYPGVGAEHHDAMLKAESPGRYFANKIRDRHRGGKV